MCPVQTSYTAEMAAAFEGQRSNLGITNVTSRVAESGDIPFGRAIVQGTADNQGKLPTATGQVFIGVSEMTTAWSENASDLHLYSQYREMNIIDFGEVWVYTEQSVVPGDDAYFRHTADTAPLNIVGRFRKDASGGDADQVIGAKWMTTTAAGGIGKVKLSAPGTGYLIAPDSSETLTAAGAVVISVDTGITYFDSTLGAQAASLADGVEGQRKLLQFMVDGGNVVITPANYSDGTTITLTKALDAVELLFTDGSWVKQWEKIDNVATVVATSGALPLYADLVLLDTTAGVSTGTLADGSVGQRMIIKMTVDGGDNVITPANFFDGTTITFDDAGDSIDLIFDGTNWHEVGTPTATVA